MNGLTLAYVVWRRHDTLPDFAWTPAALWPWLFFAFEMVVTAYEVWSLCVLARLTDHSPEADVHERRLRASADLPTVDVFMPTYNEGPEILEETILRRPGARLPGGPGPRLAAGRRPAALAARPVPAARRRLLRPADQRARQGRQPQLRAAAHRRRFPPGDRRRLSSGAELPLSHSGLSPLPRRRGPGADAAALPQPRPGAAQPVRLGAPGRRSRTSS